ncbi:UDP-N-acetylmuramoyl-tripeptide--D-alanyl-D-alanine ligase [Epibacterium sp. SM1969]|uniref:UDP-N-acetylmuramoyl-tripeptide--D-alanyl-D-alanine ligase n=1 Tax=Tritonibacter aquimaris TaxID=2663379 RepID=A0A844AQ25_9RHOB|nr:UDP-N-acetylmuramoyl-tripeptide--D-alanyl-D-alanine ligase [Tritonibacter aquimaris]MQY41028.1 UDP-N-acetylmuramoyl-tripeptide--D-alanyl-D-alanine ligase [Tritonibacter aquimaris]
MLWTAEEAQRATGGRVQGDWAVSGISIDTRTIETGDLFVALKAARDGHDFVAQALVKGAGAALVSRVPDGVSADAPLLIVDDVQTGLEALGRAARARTSAKVVAVTGSVGKTSTKEMLAAMLQDQGKTHAAVASYNNHWGVPLTLARMPRDTDFAVIEIGMNHPGEIAPLAQQAQPHVAMVTTVAAVHLEAFEDVAGIAREKAAVTSGLLPGGVAVLNADVDTADVLRAETAGCDQRWFGQVAENQLHSVESTTDGLRARVSVAGREHALNIQSQGAHFAMNALGALVCVDALGADVARAVASLALWSPVKGRGARLELDWHGGVLTVLDDSYNANPTSVGAALAVLAQSKGRKIAILGDMKELGPEEKQMHAALAALDAMQAIDTVHCVGPLMAHLHAALPVEKRGAQWQSTAEALADLPSQLKAGDILLAKGSLSVGLGKLVDVLRDMSDARAN